MRRLAVTPVLLTMAAAVLLSGCNKLQARVELNKGTSYYKNEKYQDALIQFQKGLALDPSLKRHWRSVGLTAMVLYRPGVDTPENTEVLHRSRSMPSRSTSRPTRRTRRPRTT